MRGKILNTEKATLNKILASSEIKSIVAAIGAGIGADYELEAMRYGRVAIMVDADVDGAHIRTLLLTLFWRHMKPMVQAGRLFIAQAPLYQLRNSREVVYAYDDTERQATLRRWGDKDKVTIQRYKGLGEMNPAQLRETVFSPEAQTHLKLVTAEDIRHTNHTIGVLMSSQVGPRKNWLFETWAGETEGAQMADQTDGTDDTQDEAEA
jgi:DNA gyrase subunit B